jgi:hypothetical protein
MYVSGDFYRLISVSIVLSMFRETFRKFPETSRNFSSLTMGDAPQTVSHSPHAGLQKTIGLFVVLQIKKNVHAQLHSAHSLKTLIFCDFAVWRKLPFNESAVIVDSLVRRQAAVNMNRDKLLTTPCCTQAHANGKLVFFFKLSQ